MKNILDKFQYDELLNKICREEDIRSLILFGSYAREEEQVDSDIDLLVEFSRSLGMLELMRIRRRFEDHYNKKVDLFTLPALSKEMMKNIEKDMKVLYEAS